MGLGVGVVGGTGPGVCHCVFLQRDESERNPVSLSLNQISRGSKALSVQHVLSWREKADLPGVVEPCCC